jgi:hypothetical protein
MTPHIKACGSPQLLTKMSGCGTRPNKLLKTWLVAELRQSSPSSHFLCALRLAVRGFESQSQNHVEIHCRSLYPTSSFRREWRSHEPRNPVSFCSILKLIYMRAKINALEAALVLPSRAGVLICVFRSVIF